MSLCVQYAFDEEQHIKEAIIERLKDPNLNLAEELDKFTMGDFIAWSFEEGVPLDLLSLLITDPRFDSYVKGNYSRLLVDYVYFCNMKNNMEFTIFLLCHPKIRITKETLEWAYTGRQIDNIKILLAWDRSAISDEEILEIENRYHKYGLDGYLESTNKNSYHEKWLKEYGLVGIAKAI